MLIPMNANMTVIFGYIKMLQLKISYKQNVSYVQKAILILAIAICNYIVPSKMPQVHFAGS